MHFLSFSNKKKTPAKIFEPGLSSLAHRRGVRHASKFAFFFLVNLRTVGGFLLGW
jgi:hypothetical protein